jgi:hypothetical protein
MDDPTFHMENPLADEIFYAAVETAALTGI